MGSPAPASSDRLRTYWTPTMERFFIDLMLEHTHRGNRIGHTFNKQAWTDMLAVFNAKFGSQYDKDALKSRYTSLWKHFNDIKNLLGQSGFSWDETRQMVAADDNVWDAYIKAHPEARIYKTKSLLHFNDLCLIYGYTSADGRYSRSSHDIDIDDELQGMNGDGLNTPALLNIDRPRTEWTTEMDEYFIELLLNQQGRGNKLDNKFHKQAWEDMLNSFNVKFGPQHNKRILRHRHKKLLKYYSDITVLLKQNGFSWDETQQMIVADDDVWDAYIKAHPQARSYKTKMLPTYKALRLIFGDAIDDGIQSDLHEDKDFKDAISGTKSGNARSRTCWTPPMDRFLIDLLLDQVHRGNRIGHTFITEAWIYMAISFNANFKSHHDRDVLKNRYKHLRRQYNDVKFLLDQSGFSWDETREMVTAEDHVWDAYLKAHPDARSYRVKTVPSYHKLCIIYGQDNSDGRYSRLAVSVDSEKELPIPTGEGEDARFPASNTDPMIDWTPPMDRHFIDLMLEQVHLGNKVDDTFNEQAWVHMIMSFQETNGLQYDRFVLENRYIHLIKQYIDIGNLLNQNGFSWDEVQQIVAADDDAWEAYTKDHPEAILYKDRILGHYNDLCMIFGSNEQLICQVMGTETDYSPLIMGIEEVPEDLQLHDIDIKTSDHSKKRPAVTPSVSGRCSKVQKNGKEEMQEAFSDMADVFSRFVTKKTGKNFISIESAIDALQTIPDIDDELLLDACDLLEDERKAKTFLALDATLRKKWLLRKLGRL